MEGNALRTALEAMPTLALSMDRQRRRIAAKTYSRESNLSLLRRYIPDYLLEPAMGVFCNDPHVTWMLIRQLCWLLRADRRAGLGWGLFGSTGTNVKRQLLTCEIHMLAQQRSAGHLSLAAE